MTLEEANKTIAEYMGTTYRNTKHGNEIMYLGYSNSLDALVPVWEKLKVHEHVALDITNKEVFVWEEGNYTCGWHSYNSTGNTIQEAACLATAKAIKELND